MRVVVEPDTTVVNGVPHPERNGHDPLVRVRAELDRYYADITTYEQLEPDQVLISISGITARLVGIRAELQRSNSHRAGHLRTAEVDPLLEHLDLQFKIHSRLVSCRQMEWEMTRGAPS
jgi:hypothetical protein